VLSKNNVTEYTNVLADAIKFNKNTKIKEEKIKYHLGILIVSSNYYPHLFILFLL